MDLQQFVAIGNEFPIISSYPVVCMVDGNVTIVSGRGESILMAVTDYFQCKIP